MLRRLWKCVVIALALVPHSAWAMDLLAAKEAWQRLDLPNQRPTGFTFDGRGGLVVRADRSVAFLYREIGKGSAAPKPFLTWRWHVEMSFPGTNLARPGGDDRPLAVHLWFSDADHPSLFGSLGRLFGFPHISHTITYVFGGTQAAGSVFANPFHENGTIFILRGPESMAGTWYSERRKIDADIAHAFSTAPMVKMLKYIAISADTDDTDATSIGRIEGLSLSDGSDG